MEIKNQIFLILTASIALAFISSPAISAAQAPSTGQSAPQANVPLNFYLKFKDDSKNASSQGTQGQGKNVTIDVTVEKGPGGSPVKFPVSAMVPSDTEAKDLELCASLQDGKQSCQPLDKQGANIDLSQGQSNQSSSNMSSTPTAFTLGASLESLWATFQSTDNLQTANAQLISVNNTTLNIPITVIVPITVEIQNAQICATVASSGAQTCQQIVLNPEQTAYTPVDVNLGTPTPTITTGTTAPTPSTGTTGTNETTPTASSSGTTNDTSSPSTSSAASSSNDTSSVTQEDKAKQDKEPKDKDKKSEESSSGTDAGGN
jgi:hypothetical protein